MNKKRWILLTVYVMVIVMPYIIVTLFVDKDFSYSARKEENERQEEGTGVAVADFTINLYRTQEKVIEQVRCYDYICGVVSGEMQANYEPEALKAQTVAAFTYLVYKMNYLAQNPDADTGHEGGHICDDYNHCKAYLPKQEAKSRWGADWFDLYYPNIEKAVSEVLGEVMLYNEQPINAVFHSISNGKTETAKEVWGSEIPYLQSVASDADKTAAGYLSTARFTHDEFAAIVNEQMSITLSEDVNQWVGELVKSEAGTVSKITIGGTEVAGTFVRKMLSLRSASFEIEVSEAEVIVTVYGYGHCVGMSQYGANEMAKESKNYKEILAHYYKDVQISRLNEL